MSDTKSFKVNSQEVSITEYVVKLYSMMTKEDKGTFLKEIGALPLFEFSSDEESKVLGILLE